MQSSVFSGLAVRILLDNPVKQFGSLIMKTKVSQCPGAIKRLVALRGGEQFQNLRFGAVDASTWLIWQGLIVQDC